MKIKLKVSSSLIPSRYRSNPISHKSFEKCYYMQTVLEHENQAEGFFLTHSQSLEVNNFDIIDNVLKIVTNGVRKLTCEMLLKCLFQAPHGHTIYLVPYFKYH